jgi:CubicO group peptidase (beta-lactamase class C family)
MCIVCPEKNVKSSAVDSLFNRYAGPWTLGISVMVIENGKTVYNRSFGYAEVASGHKANSATNYRIASVTKSFTAMEHLTRWHVQIIPDLRCWVQ